MRLLDLLLDSDSEALRVGIPTFMRHSIQALDYFVCIMHLGVCRNQNRRYCYTRQFRVTMGLRFLGRHPRPYQCWEKKVDVLAFQDFFRGDSIG
jgi:hypothetical protein